MQSVRTIYQFSACRLSVSLIETLADAQYTPTVMLQDVLDLGPARLFGLARLLLSIQVMVGMVGCLAFVYGTM